jgi:hypothetical protein
MVRAPPTIHAPFNEKFNSIFIGKLKIKFNTLLPSDQINSTTKQRGRTASEEEGTYSRRQATLDTNQAQKNQL